MIVQIVLFLTPYRLYLDQLTLSERHLNSLLDNTSSALETLATLSESFKNVEAQTTAFQAQCEDLLEEQKRIRELADEMGTDLQYYAYLEPLTRRLNAPNAGKMVKNDEFLDMLMNLNSCVEFMDHHVGLLYLLILWKLLYFPRKYVRFGVELGQYTAAEILKTPQREVLCMIKMS
jgi:hypothetical protein